MRKLSRGTLIFLIFLNGYVSLSLELAVLRQLSFYVGSSAVITSIIMAIFLGFMSLGYFVGESQKVNDNKIRPILNVSFLIIAALSVLAASFPLITEYFLLMYVGGIKSGAIQTFIYSLIFLSTGPFLFGFNTTLLSRQLHSYNKNCTGNIMAWDTIGSVFGSMATTLLLMPFLGVNYTVVLITILSVVGVLILRRRWWVWIVCAIILAMSLYINSDTYQRKNMGILVNNANSTISVSEYNDSTRILYMNGLPMSVYDTKSGGTAEYVNYLNNNFIYTMPSGKKHKVLVLGAGGFTLGLKDTQNEYTFVDIEHTLKDVSEKYFLGQKLGKNKKFIVADASQFLKNTDTQYDFILLDVYSNSYQVPEGLITAEFMERLKSRIAPNGIIAMNMIVNPNFNDKYSRVFDNTFNAVFPYNTTRQVIGYFNPWTQKDDPSNVVYIYYNIENDGRIYTINKTPVIYDR
ncbi:MAG: fused MFS/spermidine synthase [Alphaproteobacteria bacterium]|nr:fused MFS/spermidine synthase [Alphaproteobacteria bacterium]